jgi:hypothetical protein
MLVMSSSHDGRDGANRRHTMLTYVFAMEKGRKEGSEVGTPVSHKYTYFQEHLSHDGNWSRGHTMAEME